jgi:hypothetical protein
LERARLLHPDKGGDALAFAELQQAAALLLDSSRRAVYDSVSLAADQTIRPPSDCRAACSRAASFCCPPEPVALKARSTAAVGTTSSEALEGIWAADDAGSGSAPVADAALHAQEWSAANESLVIKHSPSCGDGHVEGLLLDLLAASGDTGHGRWFLASMRKASMRKRDLNLCYLACGS